ncbi:MAG: PfkB family carbohydrate kinase [Acidobacteriota bacterium]|nr:PfkB family carbohydrate kinase [Acidobacteriota bacterium]
MNVAEILAALPAKRALILGDICLDRWCTYDPAEAEPSRETGIPRIAVVETEITPGAGGTVANNAVALGFGRVAVLGAVGTDGFGLELKHALERGGIEQQLVQSAEISTFTYTKLINRQTGAEDRPRVDFIRTQDMPEAVESAVLAKLDALVPEFDALFVSDQAETAAGGIVTGRIREHLATLSLKFPKLIIWVDSRTRPRHFRNVMVKVNREEAEAVGSDLRGWRAEANLPLLCVTQGGNGALVITAGGEELIRATPIPNPVDICGAGDSFSAGAVAALVAGATPAEAAAFGNRVAAVTVMKRGTGTASPAELADS